MKESQYIIQIDHRLGRIAEVGNGVQAYSFVDDDDIATYYFGLNSSTIVSTPPVDPQQGRETQWRSENTPFNGPLGTRVAFKIKASPQLRSSSALFTKLGGSSTVTVTGTNSGTASCYYIDSIVRITGVTTGYGIDIPIRFARKV